MKIRLKIMVIDDEPVIRDLLSKVADKAGCYCVACESGEKAIEAMKKECFDIVFLDIRMPEMDGLQAFREIKKIMPHVIVYLVTGFATDEETKEAIREGAKKVIPKPFDVPKIIDTINASEAEAILNKTEQIVSRIQRGEK